MQLDTWGQVIISSFQNIWFGVISFLPNLLAAIIIFLVGWLVGSVLGKWIAQVIRSLKIDNALREVGTDSALSKAGIRLNAGAFIGGLVKWFVIVVFLVASAEVLGLQQITGFLRTIVLAYLPNVIVAALVLVIAAMIAEALQKIVAGSAMAAGVPSARFLGNLAKWAIWIFAILVALSQMGIGAEIINILVIGVVSMLALAGGLAFGLGSRDAAGRYVEKISREISHHQSE
jgi:small-conductance mechanosensitive channel